MPETLINDLRRIALFEGMENEALNPLGRLCRRITVEARKTVVSAQDDTKDVYFLIDGKVRVINYSTDGKAVILLDIASGGFFGEMSAIDGEIRSASVETLEDCTMLMLPETDFLMLLHDEPTITHIFLRHFVSELRKMSQRVFEFRTMAVQNRIHADLLRLAKSTGAVTGTVALAPAPTLAEIADRVSTHREAVSREISRMSKAGLLKRSKDRLDIIDLDELTRLVRDAMGD